MHTVILKANKGEFKALANLDSLTAGRILPLFEIGPVTDSIRAREYMKISSHPTITHINRKIDPLRNVWLGRVALVDGYHWQADAHTETGEHVIAYMVAQLRNAGISAIPVAGYDRWESQAYKLGLRSIPSRDDGRYCIRLDSSALEDVAEPDYFRENIRDILDTLELNPTCCMVMIDFADISGAASSIDDLVAKSQGVVAQLQEFGFHHYIVTGCSLPSSINQAVGEADTCGLILRKEMLVWQTLRMQNSDIQIESGDYGVRGPTTSEQPSKYMNGKIRHTIDRQTFVVRGHPFRNDGSHIQMHNLSSTLTASKHYLGAGFSWGDLQIVLCSLQQLLGSPTDWISFDTNHHLTFVVQEIDEFERSLVVARQSSRT